MTKVSNQTQSIKPRPITASTVYPENRPAYNEWQQGIRAELHSTVPAHRQSLKWNLNTFKNEK
jgi:antibiotic biosynthesis monooxygenase (ABM) superfamily enzyme